MRAEPSLRRGAVASFSILLTAAAPARRPLRPAIAGELAERR